MANHRRELQSIAEDIQRYSRKIKLDPKGEEVEKWAKRIASLADDLETVARKVDRG